MAKQIAKKNQILVFITGFTALFFSLWYLVNSLELIPDGIGFFGYIDDLAVILLIFFASRKVIKSLRGKLGASKSAYSDFWKKNSLVDVVTTWKFWRTILVVSAGVGYFVYTLDLIPDIATGIGYLDDVGVAFLVVKDMFKTWRPVKK